MRIVHLLKHGAEANGHVHLAVDLACAQADAGHQVWFVQSWGSYSDVLAEHGVQVVRVPEPTGVAGALRSLTALVRLLRRVRPDLTHAHMMSSAALGWLAGRLTSTPMLTTVHNSFDRHAVLMRLGAVVVAVSEADRRLLVDQGFSRRRTVVVLNGASESPRERWVPTEPGNPEPEPLRPSVMTLSGLHGRKGIHDVLQAFALLQREFADWHLNIVGSGPEREPLEQLAAELGLQGRAHFLGGSRDPAHLLTRTEVFVSASTAEPFGLVVAEARAAGTAVVATSVGGVPEVLDDGRAGILVPPEDPPALAAALRSLMADDGLRARWAERARHGAEYFSVARMARDYEQVYRRLLTGDLSRRAADSGPARVARTWRRLRWSAVEVAKAQLRARWKAGQVEPTTVRPGLRAARHIVVLVVFDEAERLPYLLEHYRELGFEHFCVIDNESTDGLRALLEPHRDVSVFTARGSYRDARFGLDWVNQVLNSHARGKWVLHVDADELLVLGGEGGRIRTLTERLEAAGRDSAHTMMLDMYSDRPSRENVCPPGVDPRTVCPLFDAVGYQTEYVDFTGTTWIKGGVRSRMFFEDPQQGPALNKTALVRWRRGYAFVKSAHELAPATVNGDGPRRLAELDGVLLHFKFLSPFWGKVAQEADRQQHTAEYGTYLDEDESFVGEPTRELTGWRQLVEAGLLAPLDPAEQGPAEQGPARTGTGRTGTGRTGPVGELSSRVPGRSARSGAGRAVAGCSRPTGPAAPAGRVPAAGRCSDPGPGAPARSGPRSAPSGGPGPVASRAG